MMRIIAHLLVMGSICIAEASNFSDGFVISWGDGRAKMLEHGRLVTLSLDKNSGSGFQSKKEYMFAKVDMQMKLVSGESAGTVTTLHMLSSGSKHDEIDFEFLGNESGKPYTLHTNIYTQGKGNREQQFRLWFDPTTDFHTYSILWNPHLIMFYVDGTPIRVFKNLESKGVPYLNKQKMKIYACMWVAEDWATQEGRVKTKWSKGPFLASYRGFRIQGNNNTTNWMDQELDSTSLDMIKHVRYKHIIKDYCDDKKRFSQGQPLECSAS